MSSSDACDAGYRDVDAAASASGLIAAMDATGDWDSTRRVRNWERTQLRLTPGERLLDVGCGAGDAALRLAADLAPGGDVLGIDASAAMLAEARDRSVGAPCPMRFAVGDACAVDVADGSFDAVRAERTLQWVPDPGRAVSEIARALREGGRASIVDIDWSTLHLDVGDPAIAAMVSEALRVERHRPSNVGRRLKQLAEAAGPTITATTTETQTWTEWDPTSSPAPPGCCSMQGLADDLVEAGGLERHAAAHFVDTVHGAARDGRFRMSLIVHGVIAVPQPRD